jgi:hypothetical protein
VDPVPDLITRNEFACMQTVNRYIEDSCHVVTKSPQIQRQKHDLVK